MRSIAFWAILPAPGAAETGDDRLDLELTLTDKSLCVVEVNGPSGAPRIKPEPLSAVPEFSGGAQPRVAICMTTCNPSQVLFSRQIDSIIAQTHENWICVVCDDGSDPAVLDHIQSTLTRDRRFVLIRNKSNLSMYHNFEKCLSMAPCDAEFVALSNHDDYWQPDKIETLLNAFDAGTMMAYSDMRIVAEDGRVISNTCWTTSRNNHTNYASLLLANTVTGGACMFRRKILADALPFPQRIGRAFHDHWLACVAMSLGSIAHIDRPLNDYVQHHAQVIGQRVPPANRQLSLAKWTPRQIRQTARGFLTHGSQAYFDDVARIQLIATVLDARLGSRIAPAKRRSLSRFRRLLSGGGWLWLAVLGAIPARAAETDGAAHHLLRGLVWRAWAQAKARWMRLPAPTQLAIQAASLSRPTMASRESPPARGELPERARAIHEKIAPLHVAPSDAENERINLLIPTIDLSYIFGGYIGKFNLARALAERGHRVRIVIVDYCDYLPSLWAAQISKYQGLERLFERVEVAYAFDRSKPLPVNPRDRWIATTWWTAHIAHDACRRLGSGDFLYLIQEFEPFTFEMGSFFALASQSYTFPHTALFSTELLRGYFRDNRLGVFAADIAHGEVRSLSFQNAITPIAPPAAGMLKERPTRKLLFYARPEQHAARNMFELGLLALQRAAAAGNFVGEWEFNGIGTVGAGGHIRLTSKHRLNLLPRQSQNDYASVLKAHDIGLALMYTPHPSLVPIEMASAGMSVVTNSFANKTAGAMREISPNFITVSPTIEDIAVGLARAVVRVSDVAGRVEGAQVSWCRDWDCALNEAVMSGVERFLGVSGGSRH